MRKNYIQEQIYARIWFKHTLLKQKYHYNMMQVIIQNGIRMKAQVLIYSSSPKNNRHVYIMANFEQDTLKQLTLCSDN